MRDSTVKQLRAELAVKQATVDALMEGFQPPAFPIVPGLSFDVLYRPAATIDRLGGDWYDIFTLPDGRTAFTIGDVMGHGLSAAVKMAQAKQAIKVAASLTINDPMPRAVLDQTNKVIFLNNHHVEFTTALYGVIDTSRRTFRYASAGHHPPILAKAGAPSRILPNHGFPLGVELELPDIIREHEFVYESRSMLVLYTDGVIEFNHNSDEGEGRLLAATRAALEAMTPEPARFIVDHVLQQELRPPDDIAVVTILFQ